MLQTSDMRGMPQLPQTVKEVASSKTSPNTQTS